MGILVISAEKKKTQYNGSIAETGGWHKLYDKEFRMLYSMADIGLIKSGSGTCTHGDTKNACTHETKATATITFKVGYE
jgi:hypothetical protein